MSTIPVSAPPIPAAPAAPASKGGVATLVIQDPKDAIGGGPDAQVVQLQSQLSSLLSHSLSNQAAVSDDDKAAALKLLNDGTPPDQERWAIVKLDGKEVLQRVYPFKAWGGSKGEMKFAGQVMELAHVTKHHPDEMLVSFGKCAVRYTTHATDGQLHANDFLMAARTEGLLRTLPNGPAAPPSAPAPAYKNGIATLTVQDPGDAVGGGPDSHAVALQTQLSSLLSHSLDNQAAVGDGDKASAVQLLNAGAASDQDRWAVVQLDGKEVLQRVYPFKAWGGTKGEMRFAGQVMDLAHLTKHHPDEMAVSFGKCTVRYTTHATEGRLHANDFLMAARTESLLRTLPNVPA